MLTRGIAGLLALFVLFTSPAGAAGTQSGAGHYCGRLAQGTGLSDAITDLTLQKDGRLAGTYQFVVNGAWESGTLDLAAVDKERRAAFVWHDKFGSGILAVEFAPGFGSFTGLWGGRDDKPTMMWNGATACRDAVS